MRKKLTAAVVLMVLAVGLLQIGGVLAENGFVIHKVDDNGDPVEGAVFDVYGKPEVSWTEVVKPTPDPEPEPTPTPDPDPEPEEPVDPAPCEHDPPVVKSVKAAEGSNLPESVGPFSFTMKAVDPAFPMVPESENGEKTLTIGAVAPYLEGEGNVESYQDGTLLLSVEFGTITFTEEGTYDYTISENPQEDTNYEYDSNVYIVRYEVTNNNGQLEAVRTFYKNNLPVEGLESIVLENTYTEPKPPETISISGTKTWNDADNQDGKRPESVTIRLHANGEVVATAIASADTEWRYSFEEMPKYDAGDAIVYTVTEDVEENYTSTIDGFDITNTYTPDKTEVEVTKQWDDAHNQDGLRPELVEVRLLANGEETDVAPLVLSAANNWTGAFTGLDEYANGQRIAYTVKEVAEITGYTSGISGNATEGFVIKNTHVPATISVSGIKTWNDANNQDGKRPEAVTIELLADNKKINKVQTTAADGWRYSFDNLPVYANGKRISYTVVEEYVPGYESKVDGFNITNSYTPGKTELIVKKRWDDANDQDGIRPTSVVVDLLADGKEKGQSATLSDANNWQHSFTDLPEMQAGKKVYYTVKEREVDGYTATTEISQDGTIVTITNKHVPEMVELSGAKTWADADNQDGKRPESVTVRLHAKGVEVASAQALAQDDWKYSFGSLPKYNEGKEIAYTLTEDRVEGYTHKINGLNVTNSYTPGKTQVDVTKVWDDDSNRDGVQPASVTVRLTRGDSTGAQVPVEGVAPLVLSADDNWAGTFKDLDEYDDGEPIAYGVVEDAVEGYTSQVTGSAERGFVITNHHEPETVQIELEKIWYDDEMFDAQGKALGDYKRPGSVTIALYDENNKEVGRADVSEAGRWKHTWTLPKKADGQAIDYQEYTVAEPKESMAPGFGQEAGHPDLVREGHYRAVVLNAPYVREEYTPVEVKLFKYSEAKTIPADPDTEEPRDVPLPGVKFSVAKAGTDGAAGTGGASQTLTTDANGKATFTAEQPDEKFVVKETETLKGYYNNGATFTIGVEKGGLESLAFDAVAGEWVKTYSLYTEVLAEDKSPADLKIETLPLSDPDGNYLEENENSYILRNTPLATLVVEKYFIDAGMRTYEDAPKEFAITLSYTDAAGNAQEKKLTVDPYGEYWNSGGNPSLCRWLVPGIPYNAEVTLKERGLGKQGYALTNTEAFVWRMDSNAPRYESDMTDEAQVSVDNTSVTFSMPAHFDPDPAWKYSEEYGGGSLGLLGARVRFQNHYSAEIDITGTKHWIDGGRTHDNASEVTLTLYRRASGSVADAEQVAGATPTWDGNKYTFANQPISDRSGNEYVYWVIEDRVEGYDVPQHTSGDGDATGVPGAPNGGLITNELSQDYVDITVTKQWDDASNQDGKRPDELTLALYRTGKDGDGTYTQKVRWVTPEISKSDNDWTYTFKNQLKYDSQRYEFIYEVREEPVPEGYTCTYCDGYGNPLPESATGARNGGSIKNTHTPETTTISGTKTWDDGDNRDGKRPASITVNLLANGTKVDSATVTPDASGAWSYRFADKPVYKNGAAIAYTVEEEAVEGYTAEVRNFDITNTHAPERVSISGTKEWKHAEDGDADPTVDSFTVKLQKSTDGTTWTDVASKTVAARTTDPSVAPNAWTFANQYKYENGVELKYRCIESPTIAGWVATEGTEGNGYKITNTLQIVTISGTKTWDDTNNQDGIRPSSITVNVKNGETVIGSKAVSETDNWQYSFTLPKYDAVGTEISYTIDEENVDGYTKEISGYNIKNTHTPEKMTISGRKTWTSSTGNNDDLDTSKIPEKYTVRLEKSTDGTNWTTVDSQEVSSCMAPPPMSPTDPIPLKDEWTFDNQPKYENGVELQYRCVEDPVPDGFTMSGGTKDANGEYNITNTYISTSVVNFSFVFDSNNRDTVPWITKTKNKTVNDYVSAQLDNGTTVYKYLYTHEVWNDVNNNSVKDEGETENVTDTYYCRVGTDYPYRYYGWYASLEASSEVTDEDLLQALETSVPVKEDVEKTFVYGCFKPDTTKQVSISGTPESGGTYDGSFDMTLGADKVYNVNLKPGTYEVTVPFVEDSDIDAATINSGVSSIDAWDEVTMVTTIKLTVSENTSGELECVVDSAESQYTYAQFASDTTISTDYGWSASMDDYYGGDISLSASGNTVTIKNRLNCYSPNES